MTTSGTIKTANLSVTNSPSFAGISLYNGSSINILSTTGTSGIIADCQFKVKYLSDTSLNAISMRQDLYGNLFLQCPFNASSNSALRTLFSGFPIPTFTNQNVFCIVLFLMFLV